MTTKQKRKLLLAPVSLLALHATAINLNVIVEGVRSER